MTSPAPDTDDLRAGAPIHDDLLALLALVGTWRGSGTGVSPEGREFGYGQEISLVHDGRPFLAYQARSWLTDESGATVRQAWRESGFWRPGRNRDVDVEVVLASNTGEAMVYTGAAGDQRWELQSASVAGAPTAKAVAGERRLYAVLGTELVYATELAPEGRPYAPHLNARLARA